MNWKISWKSTLRPCEFCCIAARPAYFPNFIYLYLTGCRLLKWTYKIEKLTWSQFWNKVWAFHGLLSASPKMGWWSESRDVELNEFKFSLASRKMLFNLRRNKTWSKRGKKGRNWPFSTKMRHISLSKYWSKSQQFYWFTLEFLLSQLNWIDHAAWGQVCQNQGVWRTIRPKLEKKLQKHFGFFLRNMSEFCTESLITLLLYRLHTANRWCFRKGL